MANAFEIVYAMIMFLAIYVQVFFLLVFFENKQKVSRRIVHVDLPDHQYLSVSFLLPVWNEGTTTRDTIESIFALDYPEEKLHIIAVDDGSTDDSWHIMQQYKNNPRVTLLQKENGGKHTALNFALPHVKTDLVVSFDADTQIMPDALKKAIPHFVHDAQLMALGGTVLIGNPRTYIQKAQEIEYQTFSFTKKMLGFIGGVLVVPGAFSVFRREVFEKIGGYKKAYNLEDAELTMRMHQYGMKIDHCHDAIVKTKGPDTFKRLYKQRLRWSYGFIKNMIDYKKIFLNRKYGNFGLFTLPMSVFTYVLLVFVFMYSLYKVSYGFISYIHKLYLIGFGNFQFGSWDPFFLDAKATTIMSLFIYAAIFAGFLMGRHMSRVTHSNFHNIPYFIIVYGYFAPIWVMKSIYDWIFSQKVTWR
ncbi:MAG: hypothetical protein RJB39_96 [Candidatus Parcubacteria bacterium]|jgi:cellulose synthase/poly-beta-1,6-N-acetylglucosamine synthase-like glycosyltransferase